MPSDSLFHRFVTTIDESHLSQQLNDPFQHTPYEIAIVAAKELERLIKSTKWNHNFGLDQNGEKAIGKMFGVLVVQSETGEDGYLAGFSGKIGESNHFKGFVPPVYDSLASDSFLKKGMDRLTNLNKQIDELKENGSGIASDALSELIKQRRRNSDSLQVRIYQSYELLNGKGESKNLIEIFEPAGYNNPPGGAGECAAPKLFQFAFQNNLKPIAIAEFWWGASSRSGSYEHKKFYPSCDHKCRPILAHMLQGIDFQ